MKKKNAWLNDAQKTVTSTKYFLANFSIQVRTDQFKLFKKYLKPNLESKVLDVGVSSNETFNDSNMFEKLYKWQSNITAACIEDINKFKKLYPKIKVVKIVPGHKLPFKDKQFDIVTAWATVEHVGGYREQKDFLQELVRVGKKIFVTTPYRGCVYEPHSGLFVLHWLPLGLFRRICKTIGKEFWSKESNLNPLYVKDIKSMGLGSNITIKVYKMFGIIQSHLLIYEK